MSIYFSMSIHEGVVLGSLRNERTKSLSKIVIVGALAESLVNFRGDFIKSLISAGHEVIAMADITDDVTREQIVALGASYRSYPIQRNNMNPSSDLMTFFALRSAFSEIKPDVILAYTIKPVIWSGLALRTLGLSARYYALITGLGLALQPGNIKQNFLTSFVTGLYRIALARAEKVIFQNKDNRKTFVDRNIVEVRKSVVVSGSGVNLIRFSVSPFPSDSPIIFLSIARLLSAKGLREYFKAAQLIKSKYPKALFYLIGPEDPSPDGILLSEVETWEADGALQYLGATSDVRPFIEQSHVYVLPSYHEGLPRTVLEAMAMGRPIITTDAPGCRETVVDGENGFLVPIKNEKALAHVMEQFILFPELIKKMGHRSREIVEERFDVHKVNDEILCIMSLI